MKYKNTFRRMLAIMLASVSLASGAAAPTTAMAATTIQASTQSGAKAITLGRTVLHVSQA